MGVGLGEGPGVGVGVGVGAGVGPGVGLQVGPGGDPGPLVTDTTVTQLTDTTSSIFVSPSVSRPKALTRKGLWLTLIVAHNELTIHSTWSAPGSPSLSRASTSTAVARTARLLRLSAAVALTSLTGTFRT